MSPLALACLGWGPQMGRGVRVGGGMTGAGGAEDAEHVPLAGASGMLGTEPEGQGETRQVWGKCWQRQSMPVLLVKSHGGDWTCHAPGSLGLRLAAFPALH